MGMKYKFEDFNTDMDANWSSIEDGGYARKIEISILNPFVPAYYKDRIVELLNDFITTHNIMKPLENIDSVSGIVTASIAKDVELDKKYFLSLFVYVKENGEIEDYIIEDPILFSDTHFAEFKECVIEEFKSLVF